MNCRFWAIAWLVPALAGAAAATARGGGRPRVSRAKAPAPAIPEGRGRLTLEEARQRVALLDDAYHLLLEEVHHAYPVKSGRPVAATVIRRLQQRMGELGWPRSRFLAVNGVLMNLDHLPKDEFERRVVVAMKSGSRHVEQVERGTLRAATFVSLGGSCFSCHWSEGDMASTAAISWTLPLKK